MTSHTRRVLELGVGLGLALTLVLTALADWHQRTAARVRADTIRLHVLANSDTWDDQLLKLQVRDAVLAAIPEAVTRADTPQQAAAALQTALGRNQQNGCFYGEDSETRRRRPAENTMDGLCRLWAQMGVTTSPAM